MKLATFNNFRDNFLLDPLPDLVGDLDAIKSWNSNALVERSYLQFYCFLCSTLGECIRIKLQCSQTHFLSLLVLFYNSILSAFCIWPIYLTNPQVLNRFYRPFANRVALSPVSKSALTLLNVENVSKHAILLFMKYYNFDGFFRTKKEKWHAQLSTIILTDIQYLQFCQKPSSTFRASKILVHGWMSSLLN